MKKIRPEQLRPRKLFREQGLAGLCSAIRFSQLLHFLRSESRVESGPFHAGGACISIHLHEGPLSIFKLRESYLTAKYGSQLFQGSKTRKGELLDFKKREARKPQKKSGRPKKGVVGLRGKRRRKKGDSKIKPQGGPANEDPNKASAKNENILGVPGRLKILAQSACSLSVLSTPSSFSEQGPMDQGSAL